MGEQEYPKVFISYAHTDDIYKASVIEFAESLCKWGIIPVIDQWALEPGGDLYKFMETSVTDPEINKVLILSNAEYAAKADTRKGGVGIEATLITPELYNQQEKIKFIPIAFDVDESGSPVMPAYLASRLYIDLTNPQKYDEEYKKLINAIFGFKDSVRPEIGPVLQNPLGENGKSGAGLRELNKLRLNLQRAGTKPRILSICNQFESTFLTLLGGISLEYQKNDAQEKAAEQLLVAVRELLPIRDEFMFFLEELILLDYQAENFLASIFVKLQNMIFITEKENWAAHYGYLVWELIILSATYLYKYKRYQSLYSLVNRTLYIEKPTGVSYVVGLGGLPCVNYVTEDYQRASILFHSKKEQARLLCYAAADLLGCRLKTLSLNTNEVIFADYLLFLIECSIFKEDTQVFDKRILRPYLLIYDDSYIYREFEKLYSQGFAKDRFELFGAKDLNEFKENMKGVIEFVKGLKHHLFGQRDLASPLFGFKIENIATMP